MYAHVLLLVCTYVRTYVYRPILAVSSVYMHGFIHTSRHVVLDEADHMLERGFADQMDAILSECYQESKFFLTFI